jgi:hypothetical protein
MIMLQQLLPAVSLELDYILVTYDDPKGLTMQLQQLSFGMHDVS